MIDVEKLAILARIKLDSKFKEELVGDFEKILGYFEKLKMADISDIEEKNFNIVGRFNIFRDDEPIDEPGKYSEDILRQAPSREDNYFKVKHILD